MTAAKRSYSTLAISLVVAVLVALLANGLDFYQKNVAMNIAINIILAISLNMVNGFTGQFSLGHAGFMSVGAYTSAAITTMLVPKLFGSVGGMGQDAVLLGALLGGGITAALAGLLVGIPSLRLKGDYLAIVTLGAGEIIRVVFTNVNSLGGALGMSNIPEYTTFYWVFIVAAVLVFLIQSLINSTYGRGFLAVRDDEIAAEAMGVNTTKYKVVAFVFAAFFAGVAGGLYAHSQGNIGPETFGFQRSVEIIVMVILGGMGSTYGVMAAAVLLTALPEVLRRKELFFGLDLSQYRLSIYALLLIIIMLTRPQGIFGGNVKNWIPWLRKKITASK